MEERNRGIHGIKYKVVQNINPTHIRGYRNREKTRCGTLFFNVEFRGIVCFYQVYCLLSAVLDYGQDIG